MVRTPTVPNPGGVQVKPSAGQFLHFILDAVGPVPIFSFGSDVKGVLFQASDFIGHPMLRYEWVHLKNPSDIQQLELLGVMMSFLTNASYTYTVELRDGTGTLGTALQISYTGAPTETASESFNVVIT